MPVDYLAPLVGKASRGFIFGINIPLPIYLNPSDTPPLCPVRREEQNVNASLREYHDFWFIGASSS